MIKKLNRVKKIVVRLAEIERQIEDAKAPKSADNVVILRKEIEKLSAFIEEHRKLLSDAKKKRDASQTRLLASQKTLKALKQEREEIMKELEPMLGDD